MKCYVCYIDAYGEPNRLFWYRKDAENWAKEGDYYILDSLGRPIKQSSYRFFKEMEIE